MTYGQNAGKRNKKMTHYPDVKKAIDEAKKRVEKKRGQFSANIKVAEQKRKEQRK